MRRRCSSVCAPSLSKPRYTVHWGLRRPTTSRPRRGDIHRRKVCPGPPRRSERRRLGPAQHYAIPWLALHSRALRLRLQRTCGWTGRRVVSRGLCSPRELVEAGRALHPALGQGVLVLLVRCQWRLEAVVRRSKQRHHRMAAPTKNDKTLMNEICEKQLVKI